MAYILTLLTGIIVYIIADDDDEYTRWHAIQAIGLGVVALVVWFVLSALSSALLFSGGATGFAAFTGLGFLGGLWNLLVLIAVILLAVKAYQGEKFRLPVIAEFADKNA